jgi:hypothetical protein
MRAFFHLSLTQAVSIVTIQLQLLTSGSMATATTTRALLFIGMTFELLAILLAISFPQFHQYPEERHPFSPMLGWSVWHWECQSCWCSWA